MPRRSQSLSNRPPPPGSQGVADGEVIELDGLRLEVVSTPGHTTDSLSFLLPGLQALLTGDTVLGRGTAVIAHPDGRLGEYLTSLTRMREVCAQADVNLLLPGHGPVLERPIDVLDGYLTHRQARLQQVRQAVAGGARTAPEVVAVVYADVDPVLHWAAELSVRAQLDYLETIPDSDVRDRSASAPTHPLHVDQHNGSGLEP